MSLALQHRQGKGKKLAALAACAAASATAVISIRSRNKDITSRVRRKQPRFLRPALLRPFSSSSPTPWKQLLQYGTDQDFVIALNFPKRIIVERIQPAFEYERARCNFGSPYRAGPKLRGRPLRLSSIDLIGVALWYLKSSRTQYSLCPIFGLVPSSIGMWLDYALEVLLRVVKRKERKDFEVRWPSPQEMKDSALRLQNNREHGHVLSGIFAITDGGRLPCADYTNKDLQNAYYEGYTKNVEVTNLFAWNFFGEIIHAGINFPGSWHDSKLAVASGLMHSKLSDAMTPPGYPILGDSAFVNDTRFTNGKIVRARKTNKTSEIPDTVELAAVDTILQRIMPSERQSAEWGVRAIKGTFGRLKLPLSADSDKRKRIIRLCVHLINFRTRLVGLSHIRPTYAAPSDVTQPWIQAFIEN